MPTRIVTILVVFSLIATTLVSQQTEYSGLYTGCSAKQHYKSMKLLQDLNQSALLYHYDIKFYHLDLSIDNDTTFLSGNVRYQAEVTNTSLDTFALELIDTMVIDSIFFNNTKHNFFRSDDQVFIPLMVSLDQGTQFSCQIFYHGTPPTGNFFIGVSKHYDSTWNQSVVWTLSEPFNARQWWPVKQVLEDKADSVWVFLTTDVENKAGSEGLLDQVVMLPNSKVRYEWKSRYPIAYYLISYAVANYQEYNIYGKPAAMGTDSILIQNYIYNSPGCLEHYKNGIDRTVSMIELFSDLYTLYPFEQEKYGHCLAGLSGGMEHQTMTTIGHFGFGIVAHELAHMWFGNNVTCSSWNDIWINEGFATYSDYLAHEYLANPQYPPIWLKNAHNYIISEPGGSVYVPDEEIYFGNESRIFDSRLTYYKGSYILHMIRYELDDDSLFFEVLQNFQDTYQNGVAGQQEFLDVLNETSGEDFTTFFDQWFFGEGYPIYNIDWTLEGTELNIFSDQSTSLPEVTPFFEMSYPIKLFLDDGSDVTIHVDQTQPSVIKTVNINTGVDSIQVDPDYWVLSQVASINSIDDNSMGFGVRVFPIPASEKIYLETSINREFHASIYDVRGKLIHTFAVPNAEFQLNIQFLERGIYFLEIESDGNSSITKFIKN